MKMQFGLIMSTLVLIQYVNCEKKFYLLMRKWHTSDVTEWLKKVEKLNTFYFFFVQTQLQAFVLIALHQY